MIEVNRTGLILQETLMSDHWVEHDVVAVGVVGGGFILGHCAIVEVIKNMHISLFW